MPFGILLLIAILAIWNPVSLALQASSAVGTIDTRSTLSLIFLSARLLITGIGIAAGMALWRRRPGAASLAKLSLVLFAIEAVARLSTRTDLGTAPPGTRLPLAVLVVAHNAAWYLYLHLSRHVRAVYGLESPSQGASMRRVLSLLIVLAVCAMPIASSAQAPGKTLDIYYIDTEGGQATLYVSPTGQTLLVDAGNSGERDLNRILDVLKGAEVKQLDHFWLTHYHGDHYGSLIDIAKQVPIKHLYDHGPSIEAERPNIIKFQAAYAEFYKGLPRTIVKPGDKLAFAGTDTTTVVSDSVPLKAAIATAPGAGRPNALCADHKPRDESKVDPDNHHSAGFVMNYGRFRTINLGDLTWSREFMLMCPNNPVGTVDLYLTNHHGLDQSGAPAFVHAIQPRVAIMNNGTRKGGAVQTFQTLETSPGLEDIWQLHWSYAGGVEHNAPGVMIANIDERDQLAAIVGGSAAPPAGPGGLATHAPAHYVKVSARNDGSFTVTNSRNGYSKTYAAKP